MKRKSLIIAILIFILSFCLRLLYSDTIPGLVPHGDAVGYIEIGNLIASSPSLSTLINPYRTPLYPLFLLLTNTLFHSYTVVPYLQFFIASLSLSLFFLALLKQKIPIVVSSTIVTLIGLSINVFGWEKSLMTEGLATTWLLLLVSVSLPLFDSLTTRRLIIFIFLSSLGFLLRPMVLPIPIVLITFLMLQHWLKKNRQFPALFISVCFYVLVPILYISGNTYFHGYRSIQQVGDVDIFARILQFKLPVEAGGMYPYYEKIAQGFVYNPKDFRPFDILKAYDPDIYGKQYMFNDLRVFNRNVILSHPLSYVLHSLSNLPKAITETSPFLRIDEPQKLVSMTGLFYLLQNIAGFFTYGHFFIFLILPVSGICYLHTKKTLWLLLSLSSTIVLSQILIGVFVVYEEYARLYAVTYPLMITSVLLFLFQGFKTMTKYINSEKMRSL